jgi:hypothetical protein
MQKRTQGGAGMHKQQGAVHLIWPSCRCKKKSLREWKEENKTRKESKCGWKWEILMAVATNPAVFLDVISGSLVASNDAHLWNSSTVTAGNVASLLWPLQSLNVDRVCVFILRLSHRVPVPVAERSRAWGCGRWLVGGWGFESRWGHGCLSLVNVVRYLVEVSASGWSPVQRSPTECTMSNECVWLRSPVRGGHDPASGRSTIEKKHTHSGGVNYKSVLSRSFTSKNCILVFIV